SCAPGFHQPGSLHAQASRRYRLASVFRSVRSEPDRLSLYATPARPSRATRSAVRSLAQYGELTVSFLPAHAQRWSALLPACLPSPESSDAPAFADLPLFRAVS